MSSQIIRVGCWSMNDPRYHLPRHCHHRSESDASPWMTPDIIILAQTLSSQIRVWCWSMNDPRYHHHRHCHPHYRSESDDGPWTTPDIIIRDIVITDVGCWSMKGWWGPRVPGCSAAPGQCQQVWARRTLRRRFGTWSRRQGHQDTGLSLVQSDHVTRILASHWSRGQGHQLRSTRRYVN